MPKYTESNNARFIAPRCRHVLDQLSAWFTATWGVLCTKTMGLYSWWIGNFMEFPKVVKKEAIMEDRNIGISMMSKLKLKLSSQLPPDWENLQLCWSIWAGTICHYKYPNTGPQNFHDSNDGEIESQEEDLTWSKPDFPGLNSSIEMEFAITERTSESFQVCYTDWHVEISWTPNLRRYFDIFWHILTDFSMSGCGTPSLWATFLVRDTPCPGGDLGRKVLQVLDYVGLIGSKRFSIGSRMLSLAVLHQKWWILLRKHC